MGKKHHRKPQSTPDANRQAGDPGEVAGIRVIGGSMRGRKLAYSGDARTRPMKDRVREAVFNLLGPGVAGTVAIDLFAGTGALGIEALSRGAVWGVFLEKHFPTAELIQANLRGVGADDRAEVVAGDTFLQLRILRRDGRTLGPPPTDGSGTRPPWLVFCSPPYEFYISREAEMLQLLDDVAALAPPGSTLVVECDPHFDPARLPEAEKWDVREYPPAVVALRQI